MCRFGPIIGILIRPRLLFGCRLRAYRAVEGLHGSSEYPVTSLCNGHTWEIQQNYCLFDRYKKKE